MAVRVQAADFDIAAEIKALQGERTDIGAIVTFTGTVRGATKAGRHHEHDARTLPRHDGSGTGARRSQAHARWPLQGTTIIHRTGDLAPGDNIVLVVTASKHRQAAFESAEFLMDYLKSKAPFWKKETGVDGNGSWVDARESDEDALGRWQSSS